MSKIDCIAAMKALGELNRLRIVRLLLGEQLGVNQISERLAMSQYNVSKHLRILKEAGLVEMEKEGQQRLYAVVPRLKNQLAARSGSISCRSRCPAGSRNGVAFARMRMHSCAYTL
jgi:DNA-binding transcriptional ArsR family regulator